MTDDTPLPFDLPAPRRNRPDVQKSAAWCMIRAKRRPLTAQDPVQLAIFGFVSAYKGYETVLNAIRLLPDNVTLVIAGGKHPCNSGDKTLDSILGFLHTGAWSRPTMPRLPGRFTSADRDRLRKRVRITGYLSQTEMVNILNGTDIALAIYSEG